MNDPLEKYRRQSGDRSDEEGTELGEDSKSYLAYRLASRTRRLVIRMRKEAHRAPGYPYLIDIMWDDSGTEIGLVFSHSTFMIKGRNLGDLALQLAAEKVGFIREFDPQKWERPSDDEPMVENIRVTTRIGAPVGEGKSDGEADTGRTD